MVVGKASTGHRVEVVKEGHGWVPYCLDCEWIGGDFQFRDPASKEARMHERGERQPWQAEKVIIWDPSIRPFQGT